MVYSYLYQGKRSMENELCCLMYMYKWLSIFNDEMLIIRKLNRLAGTAFSYRVYPKVLEFSSSLCTLIDSSSIHEISEMTIFIYI